MYGILKYYLSMPDARSAMLFNIQSLDGKYKKFSGDKHLSAIDPKVGSRE